MRSALTYRHTIRASKLGYITQSVINNLAPLLFLIFQQQFDISLSRITLLITLNFCIQLVIDSLSACFVDRIGYRTCIVSAHLFCVAGLLGMAAFPHLFPSPYAGLLCAVTCYAIGGGLIEVLISPIVEACPTDNKASVMSMLHSFYCWGTVGVVLLSTLFLQAFGKGSWPVLCCLWALLPLCNALFFMRVPLNTLTPEGEGMSFKQLFVSRAFWLFLLLMIAAGASEQGMSQWASSFAESGLHVSKTLGDLLGPCMFSLCMGGARLFYAKCGERIRLLPFILFSALLCIAAYLLAALCTLPLLALLGCALCGLSVGILWPGIFSLASIHFPRGGTAMFALLALAGDIGCVSGPSLVGFMTDRCGGQLQGGLIWAIVFPALLLICGILYLREKR